MAPNRPPVGPTNWSSSLVWPSTSYIARKKVISIPATQCEVFEGPLSSMTAAMADIFDRLAIPTRRHTAVMGRTKSLLRNGILPRYASRRGAPKPLTGYQYRRLHWGVFLTTCDIPPATVARALNGLSDADLVGDTISLRVPSAFHDGFVKISAQLPRSSAQ